VEGNSRQKQIGPDCKLRGSKTNTKANKPGKIEG